REIDDSVMQTVSHLQSVAKIDRVFMKPTEGGRYEVQISLRNEPDQDVQMAYVRRRLDEFNVRHAERQVRLNAERDGLYQALRWVEGRDALDTQAEHEARRRVASYLQAVEQIERIARYRSYHLAVLEPGL